MKNAKRLLTVALTLVMVLTLAACRKPAGDNGAGAGASYDFGEPKDSPQSVSSGTFYTVSRVASSYVLKTVSGYRVLNATSPYFEIGGIEHPNDNKGEYYRLDASLRSSYDSDVAGLAEQTSGVTIRFRTNATSFYLYATMRNCTENWQHFPNSGSMGFDAYVGTGTNREKLKAGVIVGSSSGVGQVVELPGGYQEVTVYLPVYSGVSAVGIGLPSSAKVALPTDRTCGDIVFYGSSITQGASVSSPSNTYPAIVSRAFDANCVNIGFSGGARGQQNLAQYIASRDMVAFVLDYDWNADTAAYLQSTHYNFYKTVRNAHPDIPIVMLSRPVFSDTPTADEVARREVVKDTYTRALAEGDSNVYFIAGTDFFSFEMPDLATVDRVHPNDIGHYYMAKAVYEVLAPLLG